MSDTKTEVMRGCDWHRGRSGYVGDCKYCVANTLINLSLIVDSQRQLIELLTQKLSDVVTALDGYRVVGGNNDNVDASSRGSSSEPSER